MFGYKKKSNENEFEDFIITSQNDLYRLAYSYVKNSDDAMDIIQDSILKAYSALGKLNDINLIDKWMKRIVVNTAIDYIRKNSKTTTVEDESIEFISNKSEIEGKIIGDNKEALSYVVDDLEPELKTIIILKYFHGYTINEVADILDIPISKVKNRLHKALKILRVEFKEV